MADLIISGTSCSIDCWVKRWESSDYSIKLDTFMTKSDLQLLEDSTVPGAVESMYSILGRMYYHDTTFQGNNTLVLMPQSDIGTTSGMRSEKVVFIKNISSEPINGPSGYLDVKLECLISGSQLL